jgi:hypothetical protein
MYSRNKIQKRIEIAETEFRLAPEYHSVEDVIAFESHLHSKGMYILDDSGHIKGIQNLTDFEHDWMLNEQILCKCDADYFLTRYAFLIDDMGVIRRYIHRVAQRIMFNIIADLEERESSIELQILKARQLGATTLTQALICHRIVFGYGVNAISGSADQQKTAIMANKMFLTYDMLPVWLKPEATGRSRTERGYLTFAKTMSGVSFQHGAQMSGIARGTTPTVYHLSECASFTNPEQQIEASLFKAVHASPAIFGVLESTGEGDKNWWANTWRISKTEWKRNRSRLCPLFLPWFTANNLYPTPTWLRMRPVPEDWVPNVETRAHTAKSELFVRSNSLLNKQLGSDFKLPKEQQWWWEVEHEQAKMKGLEPGFLQEYCGDDEEALQRSTTGVFGADAIIEIDSQRERDYECFAIVGQSVEQDHEPPTDCIDYEKTRIPVRYTNMREESYRWELIPLRFSPPLRENMPEDATGVLFIWHHPQQGVRYAIGVDTGGGLGEDSTCISVWALGTGDQQDVQVAEYTSAYVSHVESFAFVIALAAYYKSAMNPDLTGWKEPYVSIEQLKAVGDVAQVQMAKMGYTNFHMFSRYDGKNPNEDKRRSRRRGWYTNSWSRPILTGYFVTWAKNHWIKINSPWLIEECKTFEQKVTATGKQKMEHEDGCYDDRIFAAAMATFCPHDSDPMVHRSKKRTIENQVLPSLDLRPYVPNTFSYKDLEQRNVASIEDLLDSSNQLERFR